MGVEFSARRGFEVLGRDLHGRLGGSGEEPEVVITSRLGCDARMHQRDLGAISVSKWCEFVREFHSEKIKGRHCVSEIIVHGMTDARDFMKK